MLEIAGGILLAAAVLAVLVATLRYIVLAISAVCCIGFAIGGWFLLRGWAGEWLATAALVAGALIWIRIAALNFGAAKSQEANVQGAHREFGRKVPGA